MKILIAGPGCGVPIPPKGWGGIEKVVWKHMDYLRSRGHEVTIYNERNPDSFNTALRSDKFDIVHVHEDWALNHLKAIKYPNFVYTSHSGGWAFCLWYMKGLFDSVPYSIPFKQMAAHPELPCGKYSITNGADHKVFYPETKVKGKCVAIGLNDARKKFQLIVDLIKGKPNYTALFIGPNCETLKQADNISVLGNLPEEEVAANIRDAEYFFHLAEAEADALAVREAAMAGCKLILSSYCSQSVGEDVSWTDVQNFEQCPDNLGELAAQKALAEFTWDKIGDDLLGIYNEILKEIKGKSYPRRIGAYLQVYKNDGKAECTLKSFRKFYPDSPIYLVSDAGDDFSELANKYNCQYEHSGYNTGVDKQGFDREKMLTWIGRFKRCCDYCNTEYILYLEDDVYVRSPIEIDKNWDIAGVYGEPAPQVIFDYISSKYQGCNFNTKMYGACGGAIYKREIISNNYDKMVEFINNEFDHIRGNVHYMIQFLDFTMICLYMWLGYGYSLNTNTVETLRNKGWRTTGNPVVHIQDEESHQEIMKNQEN